MPLIEEFVDDGGGLLVGGLGWSYAQQGGPGGTAATTPYAADLLGQPFGFAFTRDAFESPGDTPITLQSGQWRAGHRRQPRWTFDPARRKPWAVLAYTVADDKGSGDSLDAAAKEELRSLCNAADFGQMSIAAQVDFKHTPRACSAACSPRRRPRHGASRRFPPTPIRCGVASRPGSIARSCGS